MIGQPGNVSRSERFSAEADGPRTRVERGGSGTAFEKPQPSGWGFLFCAKPRKTSKPVESKSQRQHGRNTFALFPTGTIRQPDPAL